MIKIITDVQSQPTKATGKIEIKETTEPMIREPTKIIATALKRHPKAFSLFSFILLLEIICSNVQLSTDPHNHHLESFHNLKLSHKIHLVSYKYRYLIQKNY